MPKKPVPKVEPRAYERPPLFPRQTVTPLTDTERQRFRQIIADPVFKKVIENACLGKPPAFPSNTGEYVKDQNSLLVANNRLHQIQGWELFEAAIFRQAEVEVTRTPKAPQETYSS